MPAEEVTLAGWTRKHDDPRLGIPTVRRIIYPKSLEELIDFIKSRPEGHFHAAGSHWALSDAAVSDYNFIETHDPNNVHQAMGATLNYVVPHCLNPDYLQKLAGNENLPYLVHVEAGKRIYQLYAELDQPVDADDPDTLAGVLKKQPYNKPEFRGPHAFNTLGSAGGQTVVGALNTGTHGGDFDRPPIADSVLAIHLVADGGKHYWIEPEMTPKLTDDGSLTQALSAQGVRTGTADFEIVRDSKLFNAVLVSAGRFGVIYSVILEARPQYLLHEQRRLLVWQDIKDKIKDHASDLYNEPGVNNHFLQIVVCLTQHAFFSKNMVGVTKRWTLPYGSDPPGRQERVGRKLAVDPLIQANQFENAGNQHSYAGDPHPSLLDIACSDADFLGGVIKGVMHEIEEFVHSHGTWISPALLAMVATGHAGLALLIPELLAILAILREIVDHLTPANRFAETMNGIKDKLLNPIPPDRARRAAGVFVWQFICFGAFATQQDNNTYEAISYAVMDQHDYKDITCNINVDSVEVFFDSVDDRLIAYIDSLINYEKQLEYDGRATVGYAAIRFTQPTRALLGMQKWPITASVEVSCLKDVSGGEDLVTYATTLALNPNFNGFLHWGQRNDYKVADVQRRYGDALNGMPGDLGDWRAALSRITDNGRLDGFSSDFTRRTGLEVVQPKVNWVTVDLPEATIGQTVTINWDARSNPLGTRAALSVTAANGAELQLFGNLPLYGSQTYQIQQHGVHHFTIRTYYTFNGETRVGSMTEDVNVVP